MEVARLLSRLRAAYRSARPVRADVNWLSDLRTSDFCGHEHRLSNPITTAFVVGIVTVTLSLISCDGAQPSAGVTQSPTGTVFYRIATGSITDGQGHQLVLAASTQGLLHGKVNNDGTACLWIHEGDSRAALIWPSGYVARGIPVTVVDRGGANVATAGQYVELGGGLAFPGAELNVLGCSGFSRAWMVGAVIQH